MDLNPSNSHLVQELTAARSRIAELETALAEYQQKEKAQAPEAILLDALLENLPDNIYFKDTQSRFIRINKTISTYFGLADPAEIEGKTDFDLFTEAHARPAYEAEQEIMRTGQPLLGIEEKETWPDGRETWVITSKWPLYDETGQIIGTFGISRDITERKQAEAEYERLQQEVIETQQRLIQELSTPIIPLLDQIVVVPLIGSIDALRAKDITRKILEGIRKNRAKVVILDITGVPLVDSGVAMHLGHAIQAARLKGARIIITGVSDAVAETIVDLGIDWLGLETRADLQTGLLSALGSMGFKLIR